jgi:hypothetical protein
MPGAIAKKCSNAIAGSDSTAVKLVKWPPSPKAGLKTPNLDSQPVLQTNIYTVAITIRAVSGTNPVEPQST